MKSKINRYHILGAILGTIIILFALCSIAKKSNVKKITDVDSVVIEDFIIVPDLTGKTEAEAKNLLKTKGLEVEVSDEEFSSFIPIGKISSQSPATNSTAINGTKIFVKISKGPMKN